MAKRTLKDKDFERLLTRRDAARRDLSEQELKVALVRVLQIEFHAACLGPWESMQPLIERIAARVAKEVSS